jgi:NAD(P)-dependent dehydrogenase (short-subunit alcohol dehydrogenase family)
MTTANGRGEHGVNELVGGTKFVEANSQLMDRPDALAPLGSLPHKDEIAEAVAFLASPRAAHITGEVINVSGGAYMRN